MAITITLLTAGIQIAHSLLSLRTLPFDPAFRSRHLPPRLSLLLHLLTTRFLPLTGLLHHLSPVGPLLTLLLHLRTSGLLLTGLLLGSLLAGLLHHLTAFGPLLTHLLPLGSRSFLSLSLSLLRGRLTLLTHLLPLGSLPFLSLSLSLLRSRLTLLLWGLPLNLLTTSAVPAAIPPSPALTEQIGVGADKRDEAECG